MPETHTHTWGPVQHGRFSGEPSRPCTDLDCHHITLDLYLYCDVCGGPIADVDEHGKHHHQDPDTGEVVHWMDADHDIVPETGEAPYDEDEARDSQENTNV